MSTPRVSVVMPSYRHEAYIAEAIGSVLGQSMGDLELIVVDDASPDGSNAVIRRFEDARLVHVPLAANIGASAAMNVGVRRARAPLVAVCNSDDMWERDKLARQLDLLERLPECAALFSDVRWIDAAGQPVEDPGPGQAGIFTQENRTRHHWLRRLVEGGNCLCHPSVLIRREVYAECGFYDEYLRQLPDYDMWLRLLQKHQIHVMPDPLVRFRLHGGNTSGPSAEVLERDARESRFILRRFFEEVSAANFAGAFLDDTEEGTPSVTGETRADPRDVWRYLLSHRSPRQDEFREIALEALFRAPPELRREVMPMPAFQLAMGAPGGKLPQTFVETPSPVPAPPPSPFRGLRGLFTPRRKPREG